MPPSWRCIQHSLCRVAEVTYRIGLLSLFWTVCGGLLFSIMMGVEICIVIARVLLLCCIPDVEIPFNTDTLLLNLNSLIVIPSIEFYAYTDLAKKWYYWLTCDGCDECSDLRSIIAIVFANVCCCVGLSGCLSVFFDILCCKCEKVVYFIPTTRNGISLLEILFIIWWALYYDPDSQQFLFEFEHGLPVFIVTCIFYLIFTQWQRFFPPFALPFGVTVRSMPGYAYANELSELQKLQPPKLKKEKYTITNRNQFWDQPYEEQDGYMLTAAIIAEQLGHFEIVKWMEEHGAGSHFSIRHAKIRERLDGSKIEIPTFVIPDELKTAENIFGWAYRKELNKMEKIDVDQYLGKVLIVDDPIKANRLECNFWDTKWKGHSAAEFAIVKGNDEVVTWLESKGAISHKSLGKSKIIAAFDEDKIKRYRDFDTTHNSW
eukprot:234491_1